MTLVTMRAEPLRHCLDTFLIPIGSDLRLSLCDARYNSVEDMREPRLTWVNFKKEYLS